MSTAYFKAEKFLKSVSKHYVNYEEVCKRPDLSSAELPAQFLALPMDTRRHLFNIWEKYEWRKWQKQYFKSWKRKYRQELREKLDLHLEQKYRAKWEQSKEKQHERELLKELEHLHSRQLNDIEEPKDKSLNHLAVEDSQNLKHQYESSILRLWKKQKEKVIQRVLHDSSKPCMRAELAHIRDSLFLEYVNTNYPKLLARSKIK